MVETVVTLTAADRCDRCGAQACVEVEHGAAILMFCAHHHREHGVALLAEGWVLVVDDRPLARASDAAQDPRPLP